MPKWGQVIWSNLCGFSAVSLIARACYQAALDKGDPSVDHNDGDGDDEFNFDK